MDLLGSFQNHFFLKKKSYSLVCVVGRGCFRSSERQTGYCYCTGLLNKAKGKILLLNIPYIFNSGNRKIQMEMNCNHCPYQ